MDKEEKEWNELIKEIDFEDATFLSEDLNLEEKIELNESFTTYFNDYCKISYLNDIKEKHLYLLNKWKFIFFQCVIFDDFYFYLNTKNVDLTNFSFKSSKTIKKSSKNSDKNFSFNSQKRNHLNLSKNNSNSLSSGKNLIITSSITDSSISNISNTSENIKKELNIINKEKNEIIINENSNIKLNEFKLVEAKKSLHIYDNEKIGGDEYELRCKRVLNLMFIFIGRDDYKILNPHKIPIQKMINRLNIKEFENDKLTDSDSFKIDVIINNFKVSDLKTLIKEYSSHFLLTEKLGISEIDELTKINFIGEISRNFIIQISNKSAQLKTYYATFKILEILNEQNCDLSEEEKNYIFKCFNLQKNHNMNIFVIITDGSYMVLRFVIKTILKIKENNLTIEKDILQFINKEIDRNKNLLNYLMSNKFKILDKLIYKTNEALKYLDNKKIRYCILFLGDKEENKFEEFYKEKEGKKNPILIQTKFNNKINNLINNLIDLKEMIIFDINVLGTNYQKSIEREYLSDIIMEQCKKIDSLSDYFKIQINFYYVDENINVTFDDKYFVKTTLVNNEKFKQIYNDLSQKQNLESLFIFIDNKNLIDRKSDNNPLLLHESEIKFPDIYDFINKYIKRNISIFENIINQKIDKKIKKLEENKNIYDKKCELNFTIIIDKLKNDKDLNINAKSIIDILDKNTEINIEKINGYIDGLINNKISLEKLINKKFQEDYKNKILKNFSRLIENIKSSIIYDYIVKKLIRRIIGYNWHSLYHVNI